MKTLSKFYYLLPTYGKTRQMVMPQWPSKIGEYVSKPLSSIMRRNLTFDPTVTLNDMRRAKNISRERGRFLPLVKATFLTQYLHHRTLDQNASG